MVEPQPPLHWGYSGSTWPTQSQSGRLKRHMSESDDCDDAFSEESLKDQCSSPGDECHTMSRKKRRGIIEKRRRDRINTSLIELKRLVPTAFEKQGSAKLEKAEILQMTVDHLKMLHAKGMDALAYDPHKFAMDYHNIGFRECASEVARYLVTVEGMDIQDPLRLRLMSHLQCFAAQRELATKQSGVSSTPPWYSTGSSQPYTPNNPQSFPPPTPQNEAQSKYDNYEVNTSGYNNIQTSPTSVTSSKQSHTLTPLTSSLGYSGHQYMNLASTGLGHGNQTFNTSAANMKPYRPWGAEMAY